MRRRSAAARELNYTEAQLHYRSLAVRHRASFALLFCFAGLWQSVCIAGQEQQASPDGATPTPAPVSSPTASGKTPAESSKASESASSSAQELSVDEQRLISQGYTLQVRSHGEKYFCKKEAALGSRLERVTCATADVILKRKQNDQDIMRHPRPAEQPPQK